MNVQLQAPAGVGQVQTPNGLAIPDGTGLVTVDATDVPNLLKAGFKLVNDNIGSVAALALSKIATLLADRVLSPVGLTMGSTNTRLSFGTFTFQVGAASAGVNTFKSKATVAAGVALGALGTIPASKWGLILAQIAADGTVTYKSAPLNYAGGYATEALAKAAVPTKDSANAAMGYATVLASASGWVAGTDAFATGTGGNPATTTNYYDAGLAF